MLNPKNALKGDYTSIVPFINEFPNCVPFCDLEINLEWRL